MDGSHRSFKVFPSAALAILGAAIVLMGFVPLSRADCPTGSGSEVQTGVELDLAGEYDNDEAPKKRKSGMMPQSKLWYDRDLWWAVMWDADTGKVCSDDPSDDCTDDSECQPYSCVENGQRFEIYRLDDPDGAGTPPSGGWASTNIPVHKSSEAGGKVERYKRRFDTLFKECVNEDDLFIAAHRFTNNEPDNCSGSCTYPAYLFRFTPVTRCDGAQPGAVCTSDEQCDGDCNVLSYELDGNGNFPYTIKADLSMEALNIATDSRQVIWATWTETEKHKVCSLDVPLRPCTTPATDCVDGQGACWYVCSNNKSLPCDDNGDCSGGTCDKKHKFGKVKVARTEDGCTCLAQYGDGDSGECAFNNDAVDLAYDLPTPDDDGWDDISAIVETNDGFDTGVAVLWSNQKAGAGSGFYYRFHNDAAGDAEEDWDARETAYSGTLIGDDHIFPLGNTAGAELVAVVKTSLTGTTDWQTVLIVKERDRECEGEQCEGTEKSCSTDDDCLGEWKKYKIAQVSEKHTRATLVNDEGNDCLHYYASDEISNNVYAIVEKNTSFSSTNLTPQWSDQIIRINPVEKSVNDVTASKYFLYGGPYGYHTEIVVLAAEEEYPEDAGQYFHWTIPIDD